MANVARTVRNEYFVVSLLRSITCSQLTIGEHEVKLHGENGFYYLVIIKAREEIYHSYVWSVRNRLNKIELIFYECPEREDLLYEISASLRISQFSTTDSNIHSRSDSLYAKYFSERLRPLPGRGVWAGSALH